MARFDQSRDQKQSLLGLSRDETREFLRLDALSATSAQADQKQWSIEEERRWLELFEKKHAAAMRPFLTTK